MSPDPRIIQLGSMLDDPDDRIAVDLIARLMLFSDDELGELPAVMQESSNPAVRRRAQWLQHALNMRRRRRRIRELMGNRPSGMAVIQTLLDLHLLWFDKDSPDDIESEVEEFIQAALPGVTGSLDDLELQLRKLTVFPENETTIHPESYCIGTVVRQRSGAASLLCALFGALLQEHGIVPVQVAGTFGLMDKEENFLGGCGNWHLSALPANAVKVWQMEELLRYIAMTLFSCSVNSDSYRYVMSFAQVLNGDESSHVFDRFPFPFTAVREN